MLRIVSAFVALFALVPCAAQVGRPSKEEFLPLVFELARLSSAEAEECGYVLIGQEAEATFACARAAQAAGRAFWLAVQLSGDKSQIWLGAAGSATGKLSVVHYNSNPKGSDTLAFKREHCSSLVLKADARNKIACVGAVEF